MASGNKLSYWVNKSEKDQDPERRKAIVELIDHVGPASEICDQDDRSQIGGYFANKVVFLTGASGFLGKCILEKLLRSCPKISILYVLIRPKRGMNIDERLRQILSASLFDRIRQRSDGLDRLSKVVALEGDITKANLGLLSKDIDFMKNQVNIVINSAASVNFNEPIKKAVHNNLVSVNSLIDVTKKMKHLEVLAHISTCYAYSIRDQVDERLYELPMDNESFIKLVQDPTSETSLSKLDRIMKVDSYPNTYTLTKAIAEYTLAYRWKEYDENVRGCIVRPSIVTSSWREPIKGWVDNLHAATGYLYYPATGMINVATGTKSSLADFIPVDSVTNVVISSIWAIRNKEQNVDGLMIYHAASGYGRNVTWRKAYHYFSDLHPKFPLDQSIRTSNKIFLSEGNRFYNLLSKADALMCRAIHFILKPFFGKLDLKKTTKRGYHLQEVLMYFINREWNFSITKKNSLFAMMSDIDRVIFSFGDESKIDEIDYYRSWFVGTKIFCNHNEPENVLINRKRLNLSGPICAALPFTLIPIITYICSILLGYMTS